MSKMNKEVPVRAPFSYTIMQIPGLKWLLVLIPLLYLTILLYYSIAGVLKLSFYDDEGFTLKYLIKVFSDPLYLKVLWVTFKTAILVTICALLVGYPIAYLLTILRSHRWKRLILGIVIVTLWISLLARTFSWVVVLQKHGIVNNFLISIGLIKEPLEILYNFPAVLIGMTHILLPFMVMNLYPVMNGIDLQLVEAAKSLGARPFKAFKQVFLPLSIPGIIAGSIIVFVNCIGFFITPALLGGQDEIMLAQLIEININKTFNWNLAASLSLLLLVTTFLFIFIGYFITRFIPFLKGGK